MKIKRSRTNKKAKIEIIPMIDVMFFLLATFVMASLAMQKINGVAVNLNKGTAENIENIKDFNINIDLINTARNVFLKEIDNELLIELTNKITKNEFQYDKLEQFLINNIDKKYLIPIFIRTCRKFINYKFTRKNSFKPV